MTQVINHDLGYKIVHDPGYDFDLGYKNRSDFFLLPKFISLPEGFVHRGITYTGNRFKTWVIKNFRFIFIT